MKNSFLIILLILISTCKEDHKKNIQTKIITAKPKPKSNNKTKATTPENVDSQFRLFLEFFSKDSTFQVSRANFPMKVRHLDIEDGMLKDRTVELSDYYLKKFLPYDPKNQDYTQEIVVKNEKAIIEISGIENGIAIWYEFKKVDGKWKLITWIDQST